MMQIKGESTHSKVMTLACRIYSKPSYSITTGQYDNAYRHYMAALQNTQHPPINGSEFLQWLAMQIVNSN